MNKWFDGTKTCLIEYGFAEDKPQLVLDIFEGRMAAPCPIDGKHDAHSLPYSSTAPNYLTLF